MGGSDQWGNIVTGTELIRRKDGGEAFAFTCPLLTKADGTKFGKTEKGNIWLDINKTSGYDFYQFWIRASDADAEKWIKIFTFLDKETVDSLIAEHKKDESKKILQRKLAEEVTKFVHGEEELKKAVITTEKVFENQQAPAESLSIDDIEAMDGLEGIDFSKEKINSGIDIVSFLAESGIFPSKGEARKTIQGGGVSINRKKVDDIQFTINNSLLLHDKYILVKKGKKYNYLVNCN
jgi:tyrosyl-tRNA synthetase